MAESDDVSDNIDDHHAHQAHDGDAMSILPATMLKNLVSEKVLSTISSQPGLCLVLQAPGASWVRPLYRSMRELCNWDYVYSNDKAGRASAEQDVAHKTVEALACGERVLGVSQSPQSMLPAEMVAAADQFLVVPHPSHLVIAEVIAFVTGEIPIDLPHNIASGLSFSQIVSCIRKGSTANETMDRLRRAAKTRSVGIAIADDVPLLADLHGMGEAADNWGRALVEDLEDWRAGRISFDQIGSTSMVLSGPPGSGKTAFVRSLSKSTKLPLFSTSVGEWFSKSSGHLDGVIKKIDEVFSEARNAKPAILLLDEIDAIPARAALDSRNRDYWLPVVNFLLTTLDGAVAGQRDGLIVVGATNAKIDSLDQALLRPGRLSSVIEIGMPDAKGLEGIFRQYVGSDIPPDELISLARLAEGSTGAQVAEWVRIARRNARQNKRELKLKDLVGLVAPVDQRSEEHVWRVAVHEAGHAVAAHILRIGQIVSISILSRGITGGHVKLLSNGHAPTRQAVEVYVKYFLAGRSAEEIVIGSAGTGAGGESFSDLAEATKFVGMLHLGSGLGESLMYRASTSEIHQALLMNEEIARNVESELQQHYADSKALIAQHKDYVQRVASELVARRYVSAERFLELMSGLDAPSKKL